MRLALADEVAHGRRRDEHLGRDDARRAVGGRDQLLGHDALERDRQLHADLVFLFVGLTIGLLFVLRATGARPGAFRAARMLLIVEVAQGGIGFVQYFTHLPVLLVGFHMLGAALIMAVMTWTVLETRES